MPSSLNWYGTLCSVQATVPSTLAGRTFGQAEPDGGSPRADIWRLTFGANGVIAFDDPGGSGGNEGFIATSNGSISLYGPANWIEPQDRQGGFCDTVEGVAKMHWQLRATTLTLSKVGTDPCDGRTFILAGTWTLEP